MKMKFNKQFLILFVLCFLVVGGASYYFSEMKHEVKSRESESQTVQTPITKKDMPSNAEEKKSEKRTKQVSDTSEKKETKVETTNSKLKDFNKQAVANGFYIEANNEKGGQVIEKATDKNLEALEKSGKQPVVYQMNHQGKMLQVIRVEE
jgi:hypothetical protein